MKKLLLTLVLFSMSLLTAQVLAEGCFHDAINVVNKPGVVSMGARIRNVACMDGSTPLATLAKGTKVRIIGQTAWTKIVMPDGRVGWIGNNYISESSSWTNVPAMPKSHEIDSYCDTTNPNRCPNPSAPGALPTWYTKIGSTTNYTVPEETTPTETENTPTTTNTNDQETINKNIQVIDGLVTALMNKLSTKYANNIAGEIAHIENLVKVFSGIKSVKYQYLFDHLSSKLSDELSLLKVQQILTLE